MNSIIPTSKYQEILHVYNNTKWTPVLEDWRRIKEQYSSLYGENTIIFYQVWSFYETYFFDAYITSHIVWQTLTSKNKSDPLSPIMSWSPVIVWFERAQKLLEKWYNVIFVDEIWIAWHKDFSRQVTNIFTPWTNLNTITTSNCWILSLTIQHNSLWYVISDIWSNTHYIHQESFNSFNELSLHLQTLLTVYTPKEIISSISDKDYLNLINCNDKHITYVDKSNWKLEHLHDIFTYLTQQEKRLIIESLLLLSSYVVEIHWTDKLITNIIPLKKTWQFNLDPISIKNLNIFENVYNSEHTLFNIINKTSTPFGFRMLEYHLRNPLLDINHINQRLNSISFLLEHPTLLLQIITILQKFSDLERLCSKLIKPYCTPLDILQLSDDLIVIDELLSLYNKEKDVITDPYLIWLFSNIKSFSKLVSVIKNTLKITNKLSCKDGEIIREGINPRLDELIKLTTNRQDFYKEYQDQLNLENEWLNCKVWENTLWVYIETKSNNIPKEFERIKSLKNTTRYITDELHSYWIKTFDAVIERNLLEYKIFTSLRFELSKYTHLIQLTCNYISLIDVVVSHTLLAQQNTYCKPIVNNDYIIDIKNGRHSIIETFTNFVWNNLTFTNTSSLQIITWPNMGWKSTYLRQCWLIVLLSQIGCFVPADSCVIGICDNIYTRLWASDNLSKWESTFFVEMSEISHILHNCTERSLVILDEVWRWTSTIDWQAIAKWVCDFLINKWTRTLFATHYHTLTQLQNTKNLCVSANYENNTLHFTYTINEWFSSTSWWIEIWELAGLPKQVIDNARRMITS